MRWTWGMEAWRSGGDVGHGGEVHTIDGERAHGGEGAKEEDEGEAGVEDASPLGMLRDCVFEGGGWEEIFFWAGGADVLLCGHGLLLQVGVLPDKRGV